MSDDVCEALCNIDPETSDCILLCHDDSLPPVQASDVLAAVGLLCCSALFSGLTLGLMSLDPRQLELVIAGGDTAEKRYASRILPLRKRGNLLLCTLLIGNVLVNSGIAILTASFTGGLMGGIASTAFIMIFGEIVPQSVCSRHALAIGYWTADLLRLIMGVLFLIAWPISKLLDVALGAELGMHYSRKELRELILMQSSNGAEEEGKATEGQEEGIKPAEVHFLCGVLSLSEKNAENIMTRMEDLFCIYNDDLLDFPMMRRIYNSGHTRVPVLSRTRRFEVVGLLSTKDLILVDPESAISVKQLLMYCGREVQRVWFGMSVNNLFKMFLRGSSHLAFVQRYQDSPGTSQGFDDGQTERSYEYIGIVTLEDVLEELIQAEIVDESDVYIDNVSKKLVESRHEEAMRRMAWHNMLDPEQLKVPTLTDVEISAVSSFLAANVDCFRSSILSPTFLQRLLARSTVVVVLDPESNTLDLIFRTGEACSQCTVVLQGRLHIVCGSEGFESDRGPWTVLGAPSLRINSYIADFDAKVMEPSRLLQIKKADYDNILSEQSAAEVQRQEAVAKAAVEAEAEAAAEAAAELAAEEAMTLETANAAAMSAKRVTSPISPSRSASIGGSSTRSANPNLLGAAPGRIRLQLPSALVAQVARLSSPSSPLPPASPIDVEPTGTLDAVAFLTDPPDEEVPVSRSASSRGCASPFSASPGLLSAPVTFPVPLGSSSQQCSDSPMETQPPPLQGQGAGPHSRRDSGAVSMRDSLLTPSLPSQYSSIASEIGSSSKTSTRTKLSKNPYVALARETLSFGSAAPRSGSAHRPRSNSF